MSLWPEQLTLEFKTYDGQPIDKWDYYWTSQEGQEMWKANYVRGAKYLAINLAEPLETDEKIEIHIYEQVWIMTPFLGFILAVLCLGHMYLTCHLMKKAGIFF